MAIKKDPAKAEKLAKIAAACAALQKKFGKESVNYLGNTKAEPLPRFSSESDILDNILGGGYPTGRMIEIFGPASSGKCLTKDTLIQTAHGYKALEDIFIENGIAPSCTQKEVPIAYPLVNRYGEIENTTHFVLNGRRTVYRTVTKHGATINSTAKHPLLVLSKDGFPVWKFTCDLKPGDVLVGRKGDRVFTSDADAITENEAALIGLVIADGSLQDKRLGMTNSDEEILEFYRREILNVEEFAGCRILEYKSEGRVATELHINSKECVSAFYGRVGLKPATAREKTVPKCIMNGGEAIQKAFIRAFVDCECNLNDSSIEISSASHALMDSIRLMLLNLGIEAHVNRKVVKGYEQNDYWRMTIYSENVSKYIDEIGFFTTARKTRAEGICRDQRSRIVPNTAFLVNEYYDSVDPCAKSRETSGCVHFSDQKDDDYAADTIIRLLEKTAGYGSEHLYGRLNEIVDDRMFFDEIKSVEKMDDVETFDFAMERTHSFIAEGIVNHNTTLCYHAIASAQKAYPDRWCGFVDSEHSFDAVYAESIGVNVGELMVAQPDTGTDAFGMVQGLIEGGAALVVIDSVAAMMPKEEAEEEDYGHNSIGAQARMMSKGLRKLTAIAAKNKCTLIFTNQIRNRIGVMYGNPETTAGGNALGYYASIRLRVSQKEKVKEKDVDGQEVIKSIVSQVTTAKNKTAAPFKTAMITIRFGEGIDNDAGVMERAVLFGVITRKGAFYTFDANGESVRVKGQIELNSYMDAHPDVYLAIKAATVEAMKKDKAERKAEQESAIDADSMSDDEIAADIEKHKDDDDTDAGEV